MMLFAIIAVGVPMLELAFGSIVLTADMETDSALAMMVSPLVAVYELVQDHKAIGRLSVDSVQWYSIAGVSFVGATAWVGAWCVERARTGK
jgi:hypothetical protein